MSNAAVGLVYDTIIAEVINAVRVDFEENGADDSALEDLKKVRLSFFPPHLVPTTASPRCTPVIPFNFCQSVRVDEPIFPTNVPQKVFWPKKCPWVWCRWHRSCSATSVGLAAALPLVLGARGVESG
jgi:hypothetical protein